METTPDAWHGSQFSKDAVSLAAETSSDSSGSHAVTEIRAPLCSVPVLDIAIVGPIILCLAGLDLILHITLDLRKIRNRLQQIIH